MKYLSEVAEFLRKVRSELRFGERSREPLGLIRIEVSKQEAWCDWLARPVDAWDAYIPAHASARNFTVQTLQDAIKMRGFLFSVLGDVQSADLRAFRALTNDSAELILSGSVSRDDELSARNTSFAMQAILLGFHFTVTDGSLIRLADQTYSSPKTRFGTTFPNHLKEVY